MNNIKAHNELSFEYNSYNGSEPIEKLIGQCGICVDGKLVFVTDYFNMIFTIDIHDNTLQYVGALPGESMYVGRLCGKILYIRDRYVFIPLNAKRIWTCNKEFSEWRPIDFPKTEYENIKLKFNEAIAYKDKVYAIGHFFPGIVKVDVSNESVEIIEDVFKPILEAQMNSGGVFTAKKVSIAEGRMYIASAVSNNVLIYGLETNECDYISVGDKGDCFSGVLIKGDRMYLPFRTGLKVGCQDEGRWLIYEVKGYSDAMILKIEEEKDGFHVATSERGPSFFLNTNGEISVEDIRYYQYEDDNIGNRIRWRKNGKISVTTSENKSFEIDAAMKKSDYYKCMKEMSNQCKIGNIKEILNEDNYFNLEKFIGIIA